MKKRKSYTRPYLKNLGTLAQTTKNNTVASYCDKHGGQKTGTSNCK